MVAKKIPTSSCALGKKSRILERFFELWIN